MDSFGVGENGFTLDGQDAAPEARYSKPLISCHAKNPGNKIPTENLELDQANVTHYTPHTESLCISLPVQLYYMVDMHAAQNLFP